MGVPALFRWLSRKYPKIVVPVVEEQPEIVKGQDGEAISEIPVDIRRPNPNGTEVDNLYLDMNGIVHPCTHPEGKPAPKTEAAMMIEVFKYTERVVNMTRPRKVLLMAIDGVAPRAKMNQQRSRRFRAADEAKTKAKEKEDAIKEWEALGKTLTDEYKNEKAWDSNAITPGTPFMDLLAMSLRYWVAYKMNTDKGWDGLQVVISDASVPGEGEHKIMDYVRRQRSQPGYDPNTTHVFYGLDADLIMLSLATHEPNFKILREDVFQQANKRGCHKCGMPGHHSANCRGIPPEKKKEIEEAKASALKPFIFLDVSILREYLQVELDVPGLGFAFDLERAIDDWVFMIFFVGNDFLPHLPSLDIREGAIDMLLQIWRSALPQMGGYLVDNGKFDLSRLQLIMDGLTSREDAIFVKRRETEQRQEANDRDKRRRVEGQSAGRLEPENPNTFQRGGLEYVPVTPDVKPSSPSKESAAPATASQPATRAVVPPKPKNPMFVSSARGPSGTAPIRGGFINPGAAAASKSSSAPGQDVVANRAAIRKANLSAADMLRAELAAGKASSGPNSAAASTPANAAVKSEETPADEAETSAGLSGALDRKTSPSEEETEASKAPTLVPATGSANGNAGADMPLSAGTLADGDAIVATEAPTLATEPNGVKDAIITTPAAAESDVEEDVPPSAVDGTGIAASADDKSSAEVTMEGTENASPRGKKRSADEAEIPATRSQAELAEGKADVNDDESSASSTSDDEDDPNMSVIHKPVVPKPLKMLGGNMVEQEDTVKLWEPGYKERYYEQKFGIRLDDTEFRRSCAKSYVEGLSWVLAYYYTGCPSWTWYYPHHFAPFASDFTDLGTMDIEFSKGQPFRPFEQLMGVFPAASRVHIPKPFQNLMTEEDSEIIDFYPEEFHVDMNGKKMLWQGVALLPFIEEKRLLDAMGTRYPELTEDEVRRNTFGNDVVFVNEDNPLYNQICSLYMKRKVDEPIPLDVGLSKGVRGTILPDESCVPNSSFVSPLTSEGLTDIKDDRSISAVYFMPPQSVPHKSLLLSGYKTTRRVLTPDDVNKIHRGVNGEDNGYRGGAAGDGFHSQRRNLEGPGHAVRRDARSVVDNRRRSGNFSGQNGRSSGYSTPDSERSYGGHREPAYGNGNSGRDPYAGYNSYNSGYNSPAQPPSGYGGRGGYSTPPAAAAPPASYGGYGGSGSYGSYGAPSSAPYRPPPAAQSSYYPPPPAQAPPPQQYGSYGSSYSSYGAPPAPYQSPPQQGYGYNAGQPPAAQPAYSGYGGYGQAQPQTYRPPSQQQQQQPYPNNRGAILPPHLQNQGQGSHTRWNQ